MLVLTLTHNQAILIDTPEGVVRITGRAAPARFHVERREGQSLYTEPASEAELAERRGAKNWVVLDSAAGKVRLRRIARKLTAPLPQAVAPETPPPHGQAGSPADREEPSVHNCPLVIDAPRWMRIWREPLDQALPPAEE